VNRPGFRAASFKVKEDALMPKKIDAQLKQRAVRLVVEHAEQYPSRSAAVVAVARQLGVAQESVRRWVRQAEVDAGAKPGVTTRESAEIKRLKAENRRLREDVEILKAAASFFAGELDPRSR
jgi:transposase-like protein